MNSSRRRIGRTARTRINPAALEEKPLISCRGDTRVFDVLAAIRQPRSDFARRHRDTA